jgi:hypothetical protein
MVIKSLVPGIYILIWKETGDEYVFSAAELLEVALHVEANRATLQQEAQLPEMLNLARQLRARDYGKQW